MGISIHRDGPMTEVEIRGAIAVFGRLHPEISRVQLFGSAARGEATTESDVDVVVHLVPGSLPRGLAGFGYLSDLEEKLAAHLGCPVDLVESGVVENARRIGNNALPRAVERDALIIYESDSTAD